MSLRGKYAWAIQTAQGKFSGGTEERDGKLYWHGTVATEAEKNEIWAAIKTIPEWQQEIVADIRVTGGQAPAPGAAGPAARSEPKTYTVKPGDTLSKIAKMTLGDANAYMKIFELNRDQLSNPDEIKPGQVLKIA